MLLRHHTGDWLGHAPHRSALQRIDEVYLFAIRDGRIARVWGLEDTLSRMRQLGLPA